MVTMPVQVQPNDKDSSGATNSVNVVKALTGPFEHLPDALPVLRDFDIKQKLLQWNLSGSLQLQRFRVHRRLPSEADAALLGEFFHDEDVQRILSLPASVSCALTSKETVISKPQTSEGSILQCERLRVSVTSMAFFEKLEEAGVVARDGSIRGCMDEDFDGCTAGDLLTEMMANPESENSEVFSDHDKQEFIFQLFSALVIGGGALRQPDSRLQPYESATRALYRGLVSVKKSIADADGKRDIEFTSRVYRVHSDSLFKGSPSRFHSCFVILDSCKRWLTISIVGQATAIDLMERVPIRFGSLQTSVKPSIAVTLPSLLSEGQGVSNASLARVCRVCTTREARYTCPRCNAPYCSVDCYRAHGEDCTEQFFESHVRSEMKLNSTARGDDQRQQQRSIQELLERVKEFQDEHQTAEDEDEEALVERMQELAMLDAAGELTLESLTSEERKKFLGEVADGRLGKLVQLWSPWWLLSERKYRYETSARRKQILMEEISSSNEVEGAESEIPQVVTVESTVLFPVGLFTDRDSKKMPKSMKNLLPGGKHPSPCLRFHLVEVLFAYALVLRAFNGDYAQDVAEAALMLLDVCKVLSADARYETVGHVCLACLEKQSSDEATVNTVALQDAQNLLQTHIFILDALNDTHILLEKYQRELEDSREKKGKKERKAAIKRLHIVLKKLQFYQTWAFLTSDDEFQQLAAEIEVYMKERKMLRAQ